MNVNVNFFLRGKRAASKESACAIYASIDLEGQKSTAFSTRIKIPAKYWMTNRQKGIKSSSAEKPVSGSYALADQVNDHLVGLQKLAYEIAQAFIQLELPISADVIRERILNPTPLRKFDRYVGVLDELIEVLRPKRRESTMLTYRTRRNNIVEFLQVKRYEKLNIQEFRYQHFEELHLWMLDQVTEEGVKRWCANTVNKHLTLVNKVLNYGVNKEYIKANPIGELGLEYEDTKAPLYLLPADRQRIYECKLQTLKKERDIAVFLYNTGLSYTDYLTLKEEHFFRVPSGEWFIKKPRDKSEVYSIIPLLDQAQKIIAAYGGVAQLPRPDISDFNKALKILGEVSKSPFDLSTSVFRETFSSMMENEYMIPVRLLMFMMGHTNPRQLRNYSRVMPARILHELKKNDIAMPFSIQTFQDLVKAS